MANFWLELYLCYNNEAKYKWQISFIVYKSKTLCVCRGKSESEVREKILSDRDQANQAYIAHSGYGDTKREWARLSIERESETHSWLVV